MSRRSWWPAVLAAVLGLLVATPGAARAVEAWPGVPICAEGTLATAEQPWNGQYPLEMRFQPCAGTAYDTVVAARWGLVFYTDREAYLPGVPMRFHADGSLVTTSFYGFIGGRLDLHGRGEIRAACLVTGLDTRLACVRVSGSGDGAGAGIGFEPLPIGDPLVARPLVYRATPFPGDHPECAGCV